MNRSPALMIGLSLLLSACSGAANQPTPTAVLVPPTPGVVAALDTRLLATVDIRYPDELAWAQGYLWVKTDDGRVVQVDPATNTVVGEVKVDTTSDPNHYCQGLASDGESLWVCSASGDADNSTIDIVHLDPTSLSVIATVAVDKIFDQRALPGLLNRVWVLAGTGTSLLGIDMATNAPGPALDLGTRCFQLAALDNTLLAACTLDNLVLRIDPDKGEVTARVTVADPRGIAANAQGVWVSQENAVVRLDPQTLAPVATFTGLPGVGLTGDLLVNAEAVWVRLASGFLYRIDPTSNTIVEQISPGQSLSGGSLLVTADAIWTTAYDDDVLLRLSMD